MKTMKKLLDQTESEVYDLELNFLGKAKTCGKEEYGHFTMVFSEKPKTELPKKFFLLPCAEERGFISYLFTTTSELVEEKDGVSGSVRYKVEVFNEEAENLKDELRVSTSFSAEAKMEGRIDTIEVEVKDISVGGMMFVSKRKMEVGKRASLTFSSGRKDITVDVTIKVQRPIRMHGVYGYGCKYSYLSRNQEAELRSFVFQEDIRQHHL